MTQYHDALVFYSNYRDPNLAEITILNHDLTWI